MLSLTGDVAARFEAGADSSVGGGRAQHAVDRQAMSLRDEISALRTEIAARPHRTPAEATAPSNSLSNAHGEPTGGPDDRLDAERLVKLMNETLTSFPKNWTSFPD